MKIASIAPLAGLLLACLSQPVCAETLAIVHGRVLTAAGASLEDGTVVVRDGRVVSVGRSVAVPADARIIDALGRTVTPGFIAADTTLGTVEVSSDGKSNDARSSTPLLSAGVDVQYALNPDVTTIPVARLGGVTRAIVLPEGDRSGEGDIRLFEGQGAAISLGQGTILTRARIGVVVDLGEAGAERAGGSREAAYVLIRAAFDEAKRFRAQGSQYSGDFQPLPLSRSDLTALLPVLDGRTPLVVGAHRAADILQVVALAKEYRLKLVIRGGEEAWRVAPQLAEIGAGVILVPTDNLPKSFETLGSTSESAARLASAGVQVAIVGNDASYRVREMRFNAGMAIARGLSPDDALKALTINPAKMFGLDDALGSIEPGKWADLVIWDGDPFEPLSQPRTILIDGVAQSLDSRPRSLSRRYGADPAQP